MQRLRLTLPKRVSKPPRPLRISWNRTYAEQPTREKEKHFWDKQYHEDADPTPRRAPIYVGAGLIAIGIYYFSGRRVHAETPATANTRRMPCVCLLLPLPKTGPDYYYIFYRRPGNQSRIPNHITTRGRTSSQPSRLWRTDCLLPGYLCLLSWVLRRLAKRFRKSSLSIPEITTVWNGRTDGRSVPYK